MLAAYRRANLDRLLSLIRTPGRYEGMNGVNALTNFADDETYRPDEVVRELERAVVAGQRGCHDFTPRFSSQGQGFSHGLNPYTDWALSQLTERPRHYYLFLGLDWYSVSSLLGGRDPSTWFDYVANPFVASNDRYWHNIWAWILRLFSSRAAPSGACIRSWRTPIDQDDAAAFIRADGGGFIFHNRIPYLRPAGFASANSDWPTQEWKKPRDGLKNATSSGCSRGC